MSLITTGFHITWNGNSSKAVTAYSLTSAADTPEMDRRHGHFTVRMTSNVDEAGCTD